ncbi:hypothetical protein QA639_09640 [Bradyrhizobium pachyrhizi]|uniref:hypothetical protein n=1 Tax=Bradyrhizobium TaxID=374 RepID=UPI0024B1A925|nr:MULTISPECIES: hypothetical protein [Bradyrhizobium]WFU57741.1 hypothetical protein QA639_09640 [Bradyrhizobium pachyrhizi]WOH83283.1 hypothetical protein RX327_09165 [Bradyrhizobium sp. BEA-2-5]
MRDFPTKITFVEMRETGATRVIVFCKDYRCSYNVTVDGRSHSTLYCCPATGQPRQPSSRRRDQTGAVSSAAVPALEGIAKHRQAAADPSASTTATDATEYRSEAYWDADDHQSACCHAEKDAAWNLAPTTPTMANVAAVLEYVNRYEDAGEEWPGTDTIGPEGWHYKLRQTMAVAAVNLA